MRKQRALATLLALVMVAGLLPTGTLAARIDETALPLEAPSESALGAESAVPGEAADPAELTTADQPEQTDAAGSVVGAAYSDDPNAYEIYPVPHSVSYPGGEFAMTPEVNVVADSAVDSYTTDFLTEVLERFGRTANTGAAVPGNTTVNLVVDAGQFTDETKFDPYTLTADNGTITITGKDTDCVYYGVATLQMMFTSFRGEKFLNVSIDDYSNSVFRGFIEGFYGGFSYAQRESQMRAIRDVKGNMYVFASKTDPYHGGSWATLYPQDELDQIKHLVDVGKAMKVHYTWSIHIGKGHTLDNIDSNGTIDEALYTQRLTQFKAKFQQLYDIGVRSFNILNDDANSGTYRVQVRFLNDMNAWLKEKGDCMPLIYCCQGYNRAWSGNDGAELRELAALDDDIYLYWTGNDVNSPITQDGVSWAYERSQQPIVTWLNYPCSEHCGKRGLFLGDIRHYVKDADGLTNQYGILANPMDWAEANQVAYFQLLSWAWNRDNYSAYMTSLWEDSFKYLQPEVAGAYLTIARNVADAPNSGRVPAGSFPESEYIKDRLEAVQSAALRGEDLLANENALALTAEFENIHAAIAAFRTQCNNDFLKSELEAWLKSLESVVDAAQTSIDAVNALAVGNTDSAWNLFSEGAIALGRWDDFSHLDNGNESRQALSGHKRLKPFAEAMLNYVKEAMALQFNPGGGLTGELAPIIRLGGRDKADDAEARKMLDGDPASYASYGVDQAANDYFGVDLGRVKLISAIDILQGNSDTHHDYFHKATLEASADGEHWTELVTKVNSHHIRVEDLNLAARYVRLRLLETGDTAANYWTYIREFTVTTKEVGLLDTNAAEPGQAEAAVDGSAYALSVPSLTLAPGEYVGLRLPALMGIRTLAATGTLPAGVKLQYSVNGVTWTDNAPAQTTLMGYVRLINSSASPVTLSDVTLTACPPVRTELSFVSSNVGIHNNQAWEHVVDGNRSTYAHTNTRQQGGQYAIFDLGAVQPVKDVTIFVPPDGDDIPHNLDIQIGSSSDPNGSWATIGSLRSDGYLREEPQPYRFFECDGEGQTARYIKLAVPDITAFNWIRINELEINKTVPQEEPLTAVTSTSGQAANADDGDLLTFFTPDGTAAGQWEKLFQAPTLSDGVTVLRSGDSGETAAVWVQKDGDSWTEVGPLSDAATTLSLTDVGAITGLRITWTAQDVPAIAEVVLAGDSAPSGDIPTLLPNIYSQPANPAGVTVPNGTALENIPLPDTVEVTTSAGLTTQAPVAWSCGSYDALTAATYTFTGEFDLADALLSNPGCFALTADVTVRAAEGGSTAEGNLSLNKTVYASGTENSTSQAPSNAVDGNTNNQWNSNHMTSGSQNAKTDLGDAWIVVDLGTGVDSITSVSINFFNLIWPTDYMLQVAGSDFTPTDHKDNGTKAENDPQVAAGTYTGNNAENAACWTTVKTVSGASYSAHPTVTFSAADFDAAVPSGSRYFRLYFTGLNHAASGNSVGVKELTVNGTRTVAPAAPNISSITSVSVTGVRGDEWAALHVPDHVVAALADGTSVRLPVTWTHTDYDKQSAAAQTFTGTLTLTSGVTNTNNVQPQLTVTLTAPPEVTGYTVTPNRVTARHRTAFGGLALPENAVLQFSNGATRSLPITWDSASYDPDSLEDQTVTGTVTRPWSGTAYEVSILVRLDPILATSVTVSPKALTLYANSAHPDRTATLTAAVGGADASDKTVNWRTTDPAVVNVDASGLVTAIGPGTANIIAIAHDGSLKSDACVVTVKWVLEGSVTVSGGPRVGSTLSADLNSFTQDAKRSIDIQWQRKGKDESDFTDLAGATEKDCAVEAVAANVDAQYRVVITGRGLYEGTSESAPLTMTRLAGLPLKADPGAQKVSQEGGRDGAITGLFKGRAYEYQKVGDIGGTAGTPTDAAWTGFMDRSGDETGLDSDHGTAVIPDLPAGHYVVRRAADDLYEAGPHRTVTVSVRGREEFHVTNPNSFDGNIVQVGRTEITEGDTMTLTVTPKEGWELVPGSLKAIEDVSKTEHAATLQEGTDNRYTLTMPAAAVTISAQFRLKTYTISHDLTYITCDMDAHDHTATHGQECSITLTPDPGYEMTPNTVTITKTGTTEPFTDYTYLPDEADPEKRVITFTHGVTCPLTISGTASLKSYPVEDQLVDLICDMGDEDHHKVSHGVALTVTVSPKEGYALPASKEGITITMGGAAFTDFTYTVTDDTHAQIVIAEGKITGALVIAATAPIPLTDLSIHGTAQVGERLTADVRPSNATVTCLWTITDPDSGETRTVTGDALVIPAEAEGKTVTLEVTGTGRYVGTLTTEPTGAVTPALADKSALRAAYDDGLTVQNDNYTAATWQAFQDALTAAASVLNNAAASQAQIDDALVILRDARAALKKPASSSTSSGSSSRPTTSVKTKEDGTKVTTVTKPDGTKVETTESPDGTKAVVETKPDGSKNQTVEQADGTKSEMNVTKDGDVTITVTDAEGEELVKTEIPAVIPEPETKFEDVTETAPWAEEAINKVAGLELVKGTGEAKYSPVAPMTRGSLATVLHRLSQGKTDYANTFKDVAQGKFYTEGVAWAAKANVVKGVSEDIFAPEKTITREQLAVMLARYAKLVGLNTKADGKALDQFADGDKTGTWAVDGMAWCVENGILKGKSGNALDPTADVTRAEVAVMLDRFISLLK